MSDDQTNGPARALPTVEIINPQNPYKILRINEADFNPDKHVPASARTRQPTPAEVALLDAIKAHYDQTRALLPPAPADHKDAEIAKLQKELAEARAKAEAIIATQGAKPAEIPSAGEALKGSASASKPGKTPKAEPQDSLAALKDL